ncbi:MAG: CvpA family protein [Eubacteriales bacterium]
MSIFIDVFLAAVILLAIISGVTKGFVRSVMNILTFAAAFVCGWLFTAPLSEYYLNTVFMNRISGGVENAINSILSSSISLDSLFSDKPEAFTSITDRYLTDFGSLSQYYGEAVSEGSKNLSSGVARYIAAPVAQMISNVLAFLTIFAGVVIVLKLTAFILDLIFRLPGLNALNRIGGFIFGGACGIMYAWIFAIVITAAAPALAALFPDTFSASVTENSLLLGIFSKYNLWSMLKFNL